MSNSEFADPNDPRVLWRVAPDAGQMFGIVGCASDFLRGLMVGRIAMVTEYRGNNIWRIWLIDEEGAELDVGGDQLLVELLDGGATPASRTKA